jgi:Protein of unknown function (DUF3309)
MSRILLIILILLIGAWPYSGGWDYYPSGSLALLLVVVLLLTMRGHI